MCAKYLYRTTLQKASQHTRTLQARQTTEARRAPPEEHQDVANHVRQLTEIFQGLVVASRAVADNAEEDETVVLRHPMEERPMVTRRVEWS